MKPCSYVTTCHWEPVLGICGETFYGLMMAGGFLGTAICLGIIIALIWRGRW